MIINHIFLNIKVNYCIKITLIILLFSNVASAQLNSYIQNDSIRAKKDIVDVVFGNKRDSLLSAPDYKDKKLFFSLMPLSGASSEPGVAVSTVNASFYMGNPETTNLSNITFYPTTNFTSYLQFKAIPNLWLNNNEWNIPGKIEIAQFAQNNYGLGANTPKDSLFVLEHKLSRVYLHLNKLVANNFFVGLGYNFDYFYDILDRSDSSNIIHLQINNNDKVSNTLSSGFSINLLYDNRKNSVNPLNGFYSNLQFLVNAPAFGSDYSWQSIYFDTRKYINFGKKRHSTLALWGLYWATYGDTPYLNLPGTALDYNNWTARGYYKSRYRGKQMLYAEAEYRYDFTKSGLWGGVVFTNIQSYTEPDVNRFKYLVPAIGTGLRLKFNKYSDSNLTFDVAVGKDSFNYYFSLNEVF